MFCEHFLQIFLGKEGPHFFFLLFYLRLLQLHLIMNIYEQDDKFIFSVDLDRALLQDYRTDGFIIQFDAVHG